MISLIGNDSPIEFMNFPDGESFVKFDYNNKPINILWRYENDAEFMTIFQMFDVMARIDKRQRMPKNLFIPYFPHARQDRVTAENQPFSLDIAATLIGMQAARTNTNVYTLDIHSFALRDMKIGENRIADLMGWVNTSSCHYAKYLGSNVYDTIIAPDKGARGRVSQWNDELPNCGFVQCEKVRDPITGTLSEPKVSTYHQEAIISAKRALLIDDIGTGFGTHIQLGKVLKRLNPNMELDLFVTHSSFTRGKEPVLEIFNKVYTTDSLPQGLKQQDDRIIRFDCTEFLPKV